MRARTGRRYSNTLKFFCKLLRIFVKFPLTCALRLSSLAAGAAALYEVYQERRDCDRDEREDDAAHGNVREREHEHRDVGQQVRARDAPFRQVSYRERERVVAAARTAAAYDEADAGAYEEAAEQRGDKRRAGEVRKERRELFPYTEEHREARRARDGEAEEASAEEPEGEEIACRVEHGRRYRRREAEPAVRKQD